ncbi:peptidoglycan -binding protein [Rhodospirillaceae bacterium SYSU D60014]|uniref:peptidoglycan -binding protein n=1 Tax=Virgifigura deserti TaxID=2268457 RepID=UPI000E673ADD
MALQGRRTNRSFDIWPGYVDVLSTLLMVIIFVLMVFVISQFFLSNALSGREQALERLNRQVTELSELLSLERASSADLRINMAELSSELQNSITARDNLNRQLTVVIGERDALAASLAEANASQAEIEAARKAMDERLAVLLAERDKLDSSLAQATAELEEADRRLETTTEAKAKVEAELEDAYKVIEADRAKIEAMLGDIATLESLRDELEAKVLTTTEQAEQELAAEREISEESRRQVAILNRQLDSVRAQLSRLAAALEASEAKAREQEVQIADLGSRLNLALASKVEELARYRSEFFGRLREVLGDRQDIQIVNDRFVFQSEVLFESGSADLEPAGREQLARFADTLLEIAAKIPDDIEWLLRVDGHTDKRPINTPEFPSNLHLSTARAISVVRFLESQGVPSERMVPAGFGAYYPLDPGDDEIAHRRNRRIELKLDQR